MVAERLPMLFFSERSAISQSLFSFINFSLCLSSYLCYFLSVDLCDCFARLKETAFIF